MVNHQYYSKTYIERFPPEANLDLFTRKESDEKYGYLGKGN